MCRHQRLLINGSLTTLKIGLIGHSKLELLAKIWLVKSFTKEHKNSISYFRNVIKLLGWGFLEFGDRHYWDCIATNTYVCPQYQQLQHEYDRNLKPWLEHLTYWLIYLLTHCIKFLWILNFFYWALQKQRESNQRENVMVTYVIVSPLSTTAKLLRVKNDSTSPATWLGALFPPSSMKVFFTIYFSIKTENCQQKKNTTIITIKQGGNEWMNYLGFDRTFDERPKTRNRDNKKTKRSIITSQRVTSSLCK